ncbi:methyltransferase [Alkaliphilus crotonatoxidans]
MYDPKENPGIYNELLHQKRVAELLLSALRLNIFSYLTEWATPQQVAEKSGYHERSLGLYLNALASTGFLEKQGNAFQNTAASNEFLIKDSPVYLGEYLIYREKMMSLEALDELVKQGPRKEIVKSNKGVEVYDFYEGARVTVPEMYTGRVQALLLAVEEIFLEKPKKILDLGGGPGIMAMELVLAYPGSFGVIFEHPSVARLPRRLMIEKGLTDRIEIKEGDFITDEVGQGYDLIIASGIFDFAKGHLEQLMKKLYQGLNPGGYLYVVSHRVSEDYQSPPQAILGWLSSHLEGLDLLLTNKTIEEALEVAGFKERREKELTGIFKGLQGCFYYKPVGGEKHEEGSQ